MGLTAIGRHLRLDRDVEILIVGGAAGALTGELPGAWTTADVDLIHCWLPQDRDAVLIAAGEAARELSQPPGWLSEDAGLFAWTLPPDWHTRRILIDRYGHLVVYAAGRLDLIAMKFVAHRQRDLEHLNLMHVDQEDLNFVIQYLESLPGRFPAEADRIAMARQYVLAWGSKP